MLKPISSQKTTPASGLCASFSNGTNSVLVISPITAVPLRIDSSMAASTAAITIGSRDDCCIRFRRSWMICRAHPVNEEAGGT